MWGPVELSPLSCPRVSCRKAHHCVSCCSSLICSFPSTVCLYLLLIKLSNQTIFTSWLICFYVTFFFLLKKSFIGGTAFAPFVGEVRSILVVINVSGHDLSYRLTRFFFLLLFFSFFLAFLSCLLVSAWSWFSFVALPFYDEKLMGKV